MNQTRDKHNAKREYRDHNQTDTKQNYSIEVNKIETGSDSQPRSLKFVSFLLFINKLSHFI